ncbi:MAG: hypothetical protein QME05_03645 [Candidatus Margulisbacteria bacterium]|nr:hypothetical protein [Candidatus Margulisiibacteriota bacterium]
MNKPWIFIALIIFCLVCLLYGCTQSGTVSTNTTSTTTVTMTGTTTATVTTSSTNSSTTATTLVTTTTSSGGGTGLPPMSGDIRVSLEAIFTQYDNSVPMDTFLSYLENVGTLYTAALGPSAHKISVAYSSDGLSFEARNIDENGFIAERLTEGIIEHASVPDAIIGQNGKIRLYFVDGHATRKIISAVRTLSSANVTPTDLSNLYNAYYFRDNNAFSLAEQTDTDGVSFEVRALRIFGLPDTLTIADPSIIQDGAGMYRLYFFCVPESEIPEGGDIAEASTHYVGCATSEASDGQTFYYLGIVYSNKGVGLTDPEIYRFGTDYKMFLQGSKIRVCSSSDNGDTFSSAEVELSIVTPEGYRVGGPAVRIGEFSGIYRLYFSALFGESTNFTASASSENGNDWSFNSLPKIGGRGSMSPARLESGQYRFYFHH